MDGLPTKCRLEKSHVFMPKDSVFYNFHSEDTFHLLFECPFSHDVAFQISQSESWPDIPCLDRQMGMDNIFDFLHDNLSPSFNL